MMEAKKITLSICNENVVVSINPELEVEYRRIAKSVSDEFAKYKERYPDVEKAKLMAFLLLQSQSKAQKQSSSNGKHPSFFKRLMEVLRSAEE